MELRNVVPIRQCVAAVGLCLHAEDSLRRGSSVDLITALVLGDVAVESALGVIITQGPVMPKNDRHPALVAAAARVVDLPGGFQAELTNIRKSRNGSVHHGADASHLDAGRAIAAARTLLDEYVPKVLHEAGVLGPGAGVAHAVAHLLGELPPASLLREAQELIQADPQTSMERTAAALDWARELARPGLPGDQGVASYEQLIGTLPYLRIGEQVSIQWKDRPEPTEDAARRSLETVAQVLLRLWLDGLLITSLEPGMSPDPRLQDRHTAPITTTGDLTSVSPA